MKRNWMQTTLWAAGLYNILWGAYTVLFPTHFFNLVSIPAPQYIEFWQCIGMIVGVYGIGYIAAASDPIKHWPITLVGLLGKIFGPIGFLQAIITKSFPLAFGATILTNDLIWWIPFSLILYKAYQRRSQGPLIKVSEQDFLNFDDRKRARFINSLSGFKSANLLGTVDEAGLENLSIISSAFHLGANPALLGFIIRPDAAPRHTLDNLRTTKFCTLNHVHHSFTQKAHQTSARYEKEQSEFEQVGLESEYKDSFKAPFVKQSSVKLGLEFISEEILINKTHFIIAKIKDVYLPEDCLSQDGIVDIEKAGTVAVSGLDCYHTTSKQVRLSYAKVGKDLKELL
jgi:flavin reductase (DIM6/NTAB) family NADH-FMN oxidoreductase RutF